MEVITIRDKNKKPLNALVDHLYREKRELIDQLPNLKFVEGRASLLGQGTERPVLKILITLENPSEDELKDVETILEIAENFRRSERKDPYYFIVQERQNVE